MPVAHDRRRARPGRDHRDHRRRPCGRPQGTAAADRRRARAEGARAGGRDGSRRRDEDACPARPTCSSSISTCRGVRASRRSRTMLRAGAADRHRRADHAERAVRSPGRALQAGALGFVLKEAADDELLERRSDWRPRRRAPTSTRAWARALRPQPTESGRSAGRPRPTREVEVLKLIALGHTNAEIAGRALPERADCGVAPRAHPAEDAVQSSRADLVRYALAHGFLDGESL